jgi:hypothetical protein
MLKSLTAFPLLALLVISVVAQLCISQVEAGDTVALAKGDRLDIHGDCSQQVWPNIQSHCLRGEQSVSESASLQRHAPDCVVLSSAI